MSHCLRTPSRDRTLRARPIAKPTNSSPLSMRLMFKNNPLGPTPRSLMAGEAMSSLPRSCKG